MNPPTLLEMSDLRFTINKNKKELELLITGPNLRIYKQDVSQHELSYNSEYYMQELITRLQTRNFTSCKFSSYLLGNVVVEAHPLLVGCVIGPVITMFGGKFVLHLLRPKEREFCIDLLQNVRDAIVQIRHSVMLSTNPEKIMDSPDACTLEVGEDMFRIHTTARRFNFEFPVKHASKMLYDLETIYRYRHGNAVNIITYLDADETLLFMGRERFRKVEMRYNAATRTSVINLSLEAIPEIILLLNQHVPDANKVYLGGFHYTHVDEDPDRTKNLDALYFRLREHGQNCLYVAARNTLFSFDKSAFRGKAPFLRRLLGKIRNSTLSYCKVQLRDSMGDGIALTLKTNPGVAKYPGPVLKIGKIAYFDLADEKARDVCLLILRDLVMLADELPGQESICIAGDAPPSVSISGIRDMHGPRAIVNVCGGKGYLTETVPIGVFRSPVLIGERYLIPDVLAVKDTTWSEKRVIARSALLELRTTGKYRELALVCKGEREIGYVRLTVEHLIPFLRAAVKYLNESEIGHSISEGEIIELEHKINAHFTSEPWKKTGTSTIESIVESAPKPEPKSAEPELIPPKAPEIPSASLLPGKETFVEAQSKIWEQLDPQGKQQFLTYVITAPLEIRKVIAGIALAGQASKSEP